MIDASHQATCNPYLISCFILLRVVIGFSIRIYVLYNVVVVVDNGSLKPGVPFIVEFTVQECLQ